MCKTIEISETDSEPKTLRLGKKLIIYYDLSIYYLLNMTSLSSSSYPEFLLIFSVISLIITKHRGNFYSI